MVILFTALALGETVAMRDLVISDGLYYKRSAEVPFSGEVAGRYQGRVKEGKEDGPWAWYREDGQLKKEGMFKDGKKDGPSIGWFGNGKKRVEVNYKDGQQQGIRRNWYENGKEKS